METIPVILDCDPGADDALGILLALSSPKLQVKGITTLCGNGTAEQMARNGARICALAGRREISVYSGAKRPLRRDISFDPRYCGEDGMCGCRLPQAPELIASVSAADFLRQTLLEGDRPVTIVATAGLTNLAEVLLDCPKAAKGIRRIITASGYFGFAPEAARAEWNIQVDPEAAGVVYESGLPIMAIGLDVTSRLKDAWAEELIARGSGPIRDFMADCVAYNKRTGLAAGSILVDAMAAAALLDPKLVRCRRGKVRMHPDREGARLMEFIPDEAGTVLAAWDYNYADYMKMMGGLVL